MNKSVLAFIVVVVVALFAAIIPIRNAVAGEVCDTIGVNAANMHATFVALPDGTSVDDIAQVIASSDLPTVEKQVLIGGLVFLADYYTETRGQYPDVTQFALAARQFCQQAAGKQRSI